MTARKCPQCREVPPHGVNTGDGFECPLCGGMLPDEWFVRDDGTVGGGSNGE